MHTVFWSFSVLGHHFFGLKCNPWITVCVPLILDFQLHWEMDWGFECYVEWRIHLSTTIPKVNVMINGRSVYLSLPNWKECALLLIPKNSSQTVVQWFHDYLMVSSALKPHCTFSSLWYLNDVCTVFISELRRKWSAQTVRRSFHAAFRHSSVKKYKTMVPQEKWHHWHVEASACQWCISTDWPLEAALVSAVTAGEYFHGHSNFTGIGGALNS